MPRDSYARGIFYDGLKTCIEEHLYMSCRYGMIALYEKFDVQTLTVVTHARKSYTRWFFDQTLDPDNQFRDRQKLVTACEEMRIHDTSQIQTLDLFTMLQACITIFKNPFFNRKTTLD